MAQPPEDGQESRLYDSNSDDGSTKEPRSRPQVSSAPLHPMSSFQGAFGESIIESIDAQGTTKKHNAKIGAKARRQKMLEHEDYDETYTAQWRRKPEAKHHPLWKLMAQISFGVHLLQQQLAKSDEEVVKILQKHVDEIDEFLERTTEDFEVSNQDIKDRTNHLMLPLEHINIFDVMLDDQKFRADIVDGNRKIELILTRTARAMKDARTDVRTGIEAVTELSAYLSGIGEQMSGAGGQTSSIYHAMKANAEGWLRALRDLQAKGNELEGSLAKLGNIVREMSMRADAASKRAVPRLPPGSGRQSARSTRPTSPAVSTPTSKYSAARASNIQSKPLPPPPGSGTAHSLRLETPSMAASRSESRRQSPLQSPAPHSPALYPARTHSPLASPSGVNSLQAPSPLLGSPRPASPLTPTGHEPSPFEGRFESVRSAPKPPVQKSSTTSRGPSVPADGLASLSKVTSATSSMRASSVTHSRTSSVKRSGSLIKRLRRNLSRDSTSDDRSSEPPQHEQQAAPQKHERSMTSDLADLMQVTGVDDSPHDSPINANATSPKKLSQGFPRIGSLRSSNTANSVLRKFSHDVRRTESPAPGSVYSSVEKSSYPDPDDLESMKNVGRRKSINRFLGDSSLVRASDLPVQYRDRRPLHKRSTSPGLPRPLTPLSQLDESDDSTSTRRASAMPRQHSRPASPVSLAQPSPLPTPRPHSPSSTLGGAQTPSQRSRFGLFPSNRPLTPSAMSYTSEAPSYASPVRPQALRPLKGERWALDDELPAPEFARPRAHSGYSNTSSGIFKTGELVGGATIVSNRDEKKKNGLGRLKHWVSGKRDPGRSRLRA